MWIDAIGDVHFEFWEGIKLNGKTYQSIPLYNLCVEYGEIEVIAAIKDIDLTPEEYNLTKIHNHLKTSTFNYQ